ncbi:DUF4279 domain-containing protein [Salinibacter altiplanensis]|uniref:DUF4279 domain-containing protein n=1 Tax=Salinibacter altiplanensis TaxID=1803181 RepID=UPI001319DF92|nr:DUF4279 domain-containing protein [Salinibacter altiplanensis]
MPPHSTSNTTHIGFSATLRVMCAAERHDEIEQVTGLTATHQHAHGEPGFFGQPWPKDLWALESPLPPDTALGEHLEWLWTRVEPHQDYFRGLAAEEGVDVDLFCGYRSDCDECGFEVQPDALNIVQALSVPLEVSVVFT